jgi:hypothetical protein
VCRLNGVKKCHSLAAKLYTGTYVGSMFGLVVICVNGRAVLQTGLMPPVPCCSGTKVPLEYEQLTALQHGLSPSPRYVCQVRRDAFFAASAFPSTSADYD